MISRNVLAFIRESTDNKKQILLGWLIGEKNVEKHMKESTSQIKNVEGYLETLEKDGRHLRLSRVDLSIIRDYLTNTSWVFLHKYLENHANDENVCDRCTFKLKNNENNFLCQRCLLKYHNICEGLQTVSVRSQQDDYDEQSSQQQFCKKCFYHLWNKI